MIRNGQDPKLEGAYANTRYANEEIVPCLTDAEGTSHVRPRLQKCCVGEEQRSQQPNCRACRTTRTQAAPHVEEVPTCHTLQRPE